MNIHPLIPEDYPVIDSYMQELHDLHVQGRPDLSWIIHGVAVKVAESHIVTIF